MLPDSKFTNVPIGIITTGSSGKSPNIVLDNLQLTGVGVGVTTLEGKALVSGNNLLTGVGATVKLWAAGPRYYGGNGSYAAGLVDDAPARPDGLLDQGQFFVRSRPQYESHNVNSFLVATHTPYNLKNDGTGDQTAGLNQFLADAASSGKIAYFPAGIYLATGTVKVPVGSRVHGSSWSQIMCTGAYFNDMAKPKIFVRVGEQGQKGSVEIVEMLFSAKGPTAGAIMIQWNIEANGPGTGI